MTDQQPTSTTPSTELPLSASPVADSTSQGQTESRGTWLSEELLGDRSEILIKHGDETYRLRRTRQDKLILYK